MKKMVDELPDKFFLMSSEERWEKEKEQRDKANRVFLDSNDFPGYTRYEEGMIRAKAKIFAEEIVKTLIDNVLRGNA